jgi:hypothetical protein
MTRSQLCQRSWIFPLASLLLAGIVGCGGKDLYAVKGKVVYKDGANASALAGGLVTFQPADPDMPNKVSSRGQIQKDGSFQMSTYQEGDGVHPGSYRIVVAPPNVAKKNRDELLDQRYRDFATSGLEIRVTQAVDDYEVVVQKP